MAHHKGRGIQFGGVHDVEESEEGIDSEFFNQLYAWNIERNRYFPLTLRKPRNNQKAQNTRGGRRGRGQANEDELLRNLAALETGKSLADADDMEIDRPKEEVENELPQKEVLMEFPHVRFNAQLTVQDDVLYIYGGTFEKGDREFTFDEMYSVDLGKLDGVKQIFRREPENWFGSEDGESEDDEDDEEDSEEDEDEDEEGDIPMTDSKPLFTESKRKSKRNPSLSTTDITSPPSTPTSSVFDDTPTEDSTTEPDDNLPHPRPFETRREFFQRTTNEWQEVLMSALRWKGIQPETLSVKEIKTRAFEMSEEKWWDCREEITKLEDEQDAAGIGEVVRLEDRDGGAGGGFGRRR